MKNNPILHTDTLILGAGLSGLSTAFHLEKAGKTDYLLVEKNDFFGGLCASEHIDGFTFDFSGHLLHLRDPYALRLVRQLLPGNLAKLKRKALVYFEDKLIPFPFQAHLWAVSSQVRQECLQGAAKAAQTPFKKPDNFRQWCLQSFGEGIYRHFMGPYNRKLWQTDPADMTWDWCGPFVPAPDTEQIQAGAVKPNPKPFGYNAHFYYPKQGGIGALANALAAQVPNTWLNAQVQRIDLRKKEALINGKIVRFQHLINTLPLKAFIQMCAHAPESVRQSALLLKHTSVHVLNIAINRPALDISWIYFPQKDTPYYRVGVQSAFAQSNAPQGCSSFYVETAEKITDFDAAKQAILKDLSQKGIIKEQDKILLSYWQTLPVAYAIYDKNRANATHKILGWLDKNGCICVGRYGLWEYSFMERSLLQGRQAAQKVL